MKLFLCAFFLFVSNHLYSKEAGTTLDFLGVVSQAKTSGLSETGVAIPSDLRTVDFNPAGIAELKSSNISFSYNKLLMDVNFGEFLWNRKNFGCDFKYLTTEDNYRNREGIVGGEFRNEMFSGAIIYAKKIKNFSCGIELKGFNEKLEKESRANFTFSLGSIYYPEIRFPLFLGVSLKDLGPKTGFSDEKDMPPTEIRTGLYTRISGLDLSGDFVYFFYSNILSKNLGIEIEPVKGFFVRMGTRNFDTFSGGIGFNFENIKVDYAFVPYKDLGGTNNFSIMVSF